MLAPKAFSFQSAFSRKRLTAINIALAITAVFIFGIAITQRWDQTASRHLSNTFSNNKANTQTNATEGAGAVNPDVHLITDTNAPPTGVAKPISTVPTHAASPQQPSAHDGSFKSYETCFDAIDHDQLLKQVAEIQSGCINSPSPFQKYRNKVMTLTAHFGSSGNSAYQRGLHRHLTHSLVHNAEFRALCKPIVDGMWNKQAHVLKVLLAELAKPKDERMEWIFWADRDTIVLDYCRPWFQFTPPEAPEPVYPANMTEDEKNAQPQKKEINLLAAEDHNGLNAGVFITRVNDWSVEFFSDVLAFRHFEPDVALPFEEQTAMAELMKKDMYKDSVRIVPQNWFNSYQYEDAETYVTSNNTDGWNSNRVRRGDFLLHLAGTGDKENVMAHWINVIEGAGNLWAQKNKIQRDATHELDPYWQLHL